MKTLAKKGLCLLFVMCLILSCVGCMGKTDNPTIFVMGDSTAADFGTESVRIGWAQVLHNFFKDAYMVDNRAVSGESAHRCYDTWWNDLKPDIKEGDYVLIQFGTNDIVKGKKGADGNEIPDPRWGDPTLGSDVMPETETNTHSYKWYLRQFIEYIDSQGAYPILVTSVERRNDAIKFTDETKSRLYKYVTAMEELSKELADEEIMGKGKTIDVPIIDVWRECRAAIHKMEAEEVNSSKNWFMIKHYVEGDTSPENGKFNDNIHLIRDGAMEISRIFAEQVNEGAKENKTLKGLSKYLVDDIANVEDKGDLPPKTTETLIRIRSKICMI